MNPPDDQRLLRESEAKFRDFFENAQVGMYRTKIDGSAFLDVNAKFAEIVGFSREELLGTPGRIRWADPEERDRMLKLLKDQGGFLSNYETRVLAKNGDVIQVLASVSLHPEEGSLDGTMVDITGQKRTEEALQESEEQYRLLVQNQGEGIGMADLEERFTFANPAAEAIFGVPPGKLVGRRLEDFMTPEQYAGVLEQTWKRNYGERSTYDLEIVRADGERRSLLVTACPRNDPQGRFIGSFGIFRDITEHKRVEETLRNQNEEMEATLEELQQSRDALQLKNFVFDASIAANSIADTNGVITEVNAAFLKVWGYPSKEEVLGRQIPDFLQNQDEVAAILAALSTTGEWEGDYTAKRKDGTTFAAHSLATVIRDEGGKVIGYQSAVLDISERRRLEDQLRVKDWVIESASNAFAISDLAGNLNYVNPAFLKLWGFRTREEILGKPATGFWQMGEKAAEVMEGLRTRGGWSGEMVAKSKEGALFDVQVVASLVLDDVGRPFCMSASFIDNTERKRVEKALQESEQRFKAIFDHSNDGILLADMEKKRFFIGNETICQMLGYSPDEIKDLGVMDIHPTEDLPHVIDQFEKQARKEIAIAKDLPVKRKDGSVFYADVSSFPITLTGKPYLVGAFRDTTERKLAEELLREQKEELEAANEDLRISEEDLATQMEKLQQSRDALRESEGKHRTLLENLPQTIFFKDRNLAYISCNENYARDLKIRSDEIRGRTDYDFYPRDFAEKYRSDDRRILESGRPEEFEERYLQEGQERWVHTIKTPVKNEAGEVIGVLGIFRDITERKSLEAQLIQAQKMEAVGLLAGGIAHEFNNILGGILGYASLMRLKMEPDHPFRGYVETIEKSSQRAALLTSQLLGFARKGKYDLRLLNLNLLAEDTLAIVRQTFDRAVTVEARLAESLPKVEGDTMQLQQVLMNLCINARDAMPKGGSLVLTTRTEQVAEGDERIPPESKAGLYVLLSVADTGCGMDEETQAKIFEPFFTTKEKGKGTGLGLAMVYGVVKNHGGFVTVRSEVGRGSAFTLHLPAAEKPSERRPEALAAPEKSRGAVPDQTILVVDDEESIRSLAKDILEGEGYRVLLAEDGPQALEAYREHQGEIGLVVLDIIMPKLGGGEVFLKLKEMDPGVHVLVSSGYSQEGKAQEILSGGALGFVQKPFHVRDLISKVRQGLDGGGIQNVK